MRQHDTGLFSVAVINMNPVHTLALELQLPTETASLSFYRFTYTSGDAQNGVVSNCTLPKPNQNEKIVVGRSAVLKDSVPPATLVVYSEYT